MILDKQPLPGDEVDLQDAPPSYDALEGVPPPPPPPEKAGSSASHRALPPNPALSASSPAGKRPGKLEHAAAWFNFGPSARAVKEIRSTLLTLLHDLVKQGDTHGALGVLESCADACKTYDLSLSSLLQEASAGGHSPIYWAIIKRPAVPEPSLHPHPHEPLHGSDGDVDLVTALLSRAAPLSDATIDELRLACLQTSDQHLFQRLRRSRAFTPLTNNKEEILLGPDTPPDDVSVENVPEDKNAFVMRATLHKFQQRVMIAGSVHVEFIAKGRLWELSFLVAKDFDRRLGYKGFEAGSWVVKLALLPHSPPTWIDSRLVIDDPRARRPPLDRVAPPSSSSPGPSSSPLSTSFMGAVRDRYTQQQQPKLEPRVELRLRKHEQLAAPHAWSLTSMVVVPLEGNVHANSLQFKDCPYLESDGSLVARLEARLAPPETECVIC